MIGSFEAAQFDAVNGWLHDLTSFAEDDPQYAFDDIIASVASVNSAERAFTNLIPVERLYVVPFFAETSVLMYNQAIIDAAGVTVPEQPTWDEIAQIAELVHTDEVAGICLNGSVGWDELGASLTTVVNTFGGTWWEANEDGTPGQAQINQPDSGFRAATETYVDLLRNFGQEDPGSDQCLQIMQDGGAAMWFGSSTSAQQLNQEGLAGNLGVARAPVGPLAFPAVAYQAGGLHYQSAATTTKSHTRGSSSAGRRPMTSSASSAKPTAGRTHRAAPDSPHMRTRTTKPPTARSQMSRSTSCLP